MQNEPAKEHRCLSKKAVAARLSVHPETVGRLVREGRFPRPLKFSARGVCRWPEHVVDAWEEAQLARNQTCTKALIPTDTGVRLQCA